MKLFIVLKTITILNVMTLILFDSWFAVYARGPEIKFGHIGVEQGLSEGLVMSICQDSNGFMWFGTQDGLNKYDGYTFTVYKHDADNPHSLSNNFILSIYEDSSGVLWIGSWGGLSRFDSEKERFHHYLHDPDDAHSLSDNKVLTIYEDSSGMLWIGTENGGLNQFDRETEQFTHYQYDPDNPHSLSHNHVRSVCEDRSGTLWIGTYGGGLNKFDRKTGQFTRYQYASDNLRSLSHDNVTTVYEDASGMLWIGTEGGLNQFDRDAQQFIRYQNDPDDSSSLVHNHVKAVHEDRFGTLWVATYGGGLNALDRESASVSDRGPFIRYQHDSTNPDSVSSNLLWSLYEDQAGILWIGTANGLNTFDRARHKFAHYRHIPGDPQSLSHSMVWSIHEDRDGTLWIGTFGGGLNRLDGETGHFIHYRHDPDNPFSLSDDAVRFVYEDRAGVLWIGTENGGLNKFVRETGQFIRYQHDPDDPRSLSHNAVWTIYEDRSGEMWIGTFGGGLNEFDRENELFIRYQHDPNNPYSLSDNNVAVLYEDSLGTLWVGATGGINSFDQETEQFTHYQHSPDEPQSLSNNAIVSIYEDTSGTLWIGTLGGLDKFDRTHATFRHYREQDGLPNDVITGILEDDQGNLWLSTLKGLSKFHPQTEVFTNYDVSDGLQSDKFSISSFCKSRDGTMFFGGKNGFNAFYPEEVVDNPYVPPIVLTDFQLFNTSVPVGGEDSPLHKSLAEIEEIVLSYRDSVFSFEFASLHYSEPEANQYAYMLEGFDEDWNYTDAKRRFVAYTNLDGGKYRFRVKGSNSDGVWNEEGVAVNITIIPPFWETWWFRGIMSVLVLGMIIGGFYWRVRAVEIQRRQLEIQVAERTLALQKAKEVAEDAKEKALEAKNEAEIANRTKSEFLSKMSHELRTPLNSILGYAQILQRDAEVSSRQIDGLRIIHQSGQHLLTLINDILDLAKIEAGKLELSPSKFHLSNFLRSIAGIIRMRAEQKALFFAYEPLTLLPPGIRADETRLRQVLLNLLGNAVKFTDKGHVLLNLSVIEEFESDTGMPHAKLRFEVTDTGAGIAPEQVEQVFQPFEQAGDSARRTEGTGLGLAISRQLVQAMQGELHVKSQLGEGSTFWFDIIVPVVTIESDVNVAPERKIVGYTGPRRKVLIVDDKEYNRLVLVNLLEPLGFDIATASDGREGVDKARHMQPDVILTDLIMPVMTGIEAVQQIRQIPELQHVCIIAISASVLDMDQQQSKVAGCDDFLPKPVNAEKLFELLASHLKLEWVYKRADERIDEIQYRQANIQHIVPPPPEELKTLFEIARRGNMRKIRERVAQLAQMDEAYRPFTDALQQLAKGYEEEEIQTLLQSYIGEDQ